MLTNDALTNMRALPYLNAETHKRVRPSENTLGACPLVLFSKNVVYQEHMLTLPLLQWIGNAWMLSCALGYIPADNA